MAISRVLYATHLCIFLYSLFFWIQAGVMPFLTKKLDVDAVLYGYLQTVFAVAQLCGGPIFGRFGDRYGSQAAMLLAFVSTAVSSFILGIAWNKPMLFISRSAALFMHVMQGGLMIVTDLSTEAERADAIAKLGVSYGVGFALGPLIGGTIAKFYSEQTAALVASTGSALCVILVIYTIPTNTKRSTKTNETTDVKSDQRQKPVLSSVFNVREFIKLVQAPGAIFLLTVKFCMGVPAGIFQSMFAVVSTEQFGLTAQLNGYLMSYVGGLSLIMQGFGVRFVTKRFSESSLMQTAVIIGAFTFLALSFVQTLFTLVIVLIPLVISMTMTSVLISSGLTKTVDCQDTGAMIGMNMAVNSFIRSVSPLIGGYLFQYAGFSSIGYLGFTCCLLTSAFLAVKQ